MESDRKRVSKTVIPVPGLAAIRLQKGYSTQQKLTDFTGLSTDVIQKIEHDPPIPVASDSLHRYKNALHLSWVQVCQMTQSGPKSAPPDANKIGHWRITNPGPWNTDPTGFQWKLCELRYENDPGRKARGKLYDLKQQLARQTLDEIQHWLTRHGTVSDRVKMLSLHVGRNIDFFLEADSQHWWVIDDWIDGPSLEEVLLRGPLERAHTLHVMLEVAEVLQVLHAEGLVYRALDPRSIFMTPTGTVVTNFELTKIMGAVKSVHPTAQWPNWTVFVAPEVKGRGKVEPSVDLFSWGMILSYALTGKMPTGPDPAKRVIAASGLPKKVIEFAVRCCDQKKRPITFDPIAKFLEENASRRGASRGPK